MDAAEKAVAGPALLPMLPELHAAAPVGAGGRAVMLALYDAAMPAALMSLVWWAMVLRRQRDEARRERDALRALLSDAGANQEPQSTGTVTVSPPRWRGAP